MKCLAFCFLPLCLSAADAVVRASQFGYSSEDATDCLQSAIDSGARRIVVDRQEGDWIVRPLRLRSNQEIVFEDGVVVRAKKGEFKGVGDSLFSAVDAKNVVLRGEGRATLEMNKADYRDATVYRRSEWRHVILFRRVTDGFVSNLCLRAAGGDGVYVAGCRNLRMLSLEATENSRQGMSVIGVRGLHVCDSVFRNTGDAPPAAGIDFEPNEPGEAITGVLVERCRFEGNRGCGADFNFARHTARSEPVDITLRSCRMTGNGSYGIGLNASYGTPVRGRILFDDCAVEKSAKRSLRIVNQVAGRLGIAFRRCSFDGRGVAAPTVQFCNASLFRTFGSVSFEACRLACDDNVEPLAYDALDENGMKDVVGTIRVTRGAKTFDFSLDDFAAQRPSDPILGCFGKMRRPLRDLKPASPDFRRSERTAFPWFRNEMGFAQFVPVPGEYPIAVCLEPVGHGQLQALVEVYAPDGKSIDRFRARGARTDYTIKAGSPGVYRLQLHSFGHAICVDSPWPGQGVMADVPVGLIGGRKNAAPYRFSFAVPAGVREVAVQILPAGEGERAHGRLLDAGGRIVADGGLRGVGHILRAKRPEGAGFEVWTLELPVVEEDCAFALTSSVIPVAAFEDGLVLK